MQNDLFGQAAEAPIPAPAEAVVFSEHPSSDYAPRTGINARSANLTVAFALDFSTAGEKLTARQAGDRYVGITFGSDIDEAAKTLSDALDKWDAKVLNVAGNGIYSLPGYRQQDVNAWVFKVFQKAFHGRGMNHVRSGGQTGLDWAGLVAGAALGLPIIGLWPRGFKQRNVAHRDVNRTAADLKAELTRDVAALKAA